MQPSGELYSTHELLLAIDGPLGMRLAAGDNAIIELVADGLAHRNGLAVGDIIIDIDGTLMVQSLSHAGDGRARCSTLLLAEPWTADT